MRYVVQLHTSCPNCCCRTAASTFADASNCLAMRIRGERNFKGGKNLSHKPGSSAFPTGANRGKQAFALCHHCAGILCLSSP